jgi:hypothetical protein
MTKLGIIDAFRTRSRTQRLASKCSPQQRERDAALPDPVFSVYGSTTLFLSLAESNEVAL